MDLTSDELFNKFDQHSNNKDVVMNLIYELQYRRFASKEKKVEVLEKLIDLLTSESISNNEQFKYNESRETYESDELESTPNTDDYDEHHHYECIKKQRNEIIQGDFRLWRKVGVLKASGYSVNQQDNLADHERQAILDIILLIDDLNDIGDKEYANEWGEPESEERLNKVKGSIKRFIKDAKKINNRDMDLAISKWESDIKYIEDNYEVSNEF